MINKLTIVFVLVSMIFSIIEMTVDPGFYVGRIFLGLSVFSLICMSIEFIHDQWRLVPEKIKK
ncbi:hypothetical protein [Companilactobacillus mishanensis]|uniref:Uncharacterized protein n=1 Tax=Companilactobacillus mishanensis TaxID=2486008 RepID=A0A5P0ZJI4_9LACO|nr:hypothetical protein [Companilactobacillus mishanensis]MQS45309.1 hypothetical protein [Companilactobacillus mishanensis]MQS53271.1 hypothetical protein [Companilactobacillus mishanensis]MQS90045.1 hypothetical protein [Companilactobacillus mishanensis]